MTIWEHQDSCLGIIGILMTVKCVLLRRMFIVLSAMWRDPAKNGRVLGLGPKEYGEAK
jgi:hypothetical protein